MLTNIQQRTLNNKGIVKIIIACLQAINKGYNVKKYNYLLNQAIRQYIIPPQNWHISKVAEIVWNQITTNNYCNYFYKELFTTNNNVTVSIPTYNGNSRSNRFPYKITANQKIQFNKLFVCEHTIPVSDVISSLINFAKTKNDIIDILDCIHITRMLRIEESGIGISRNRINGYNKTHSTNINILTPNIFSTLANYVYQNQYKSKLTAYPNFIKYIQQQYPNFNPQIIEIS